MACGSGSTPAASRDTATSRTAAAGRSTGWPGSARRRSRPRSPASARARNRAPAGEPSAGMKAASARTIGSRPGNRKESARSLRTWPVIKRCSAMWKWLGEAAKLWSAGNQSFGKSSRTRPIFGLRPAVVPPDPSHRREQQGAGHAHVAKPPERRQRFAQRGAIDQQHEDGQSQEHRTMAAGQRLQGEEQDGQAQVAGPSVLEVGVDESQRKRHPLHRRQVMLAHAEEARRREREDDPAHGRAVRSNAELARQQPCAQRRTAHGSAAPPG